MKLHVFRVLTEKFALLSFALSAAGVCGGCAVDVVDMRPNYAVSSTSTSTSGWSEPAPADFNAVEASTADHSCNGNSRSYEDYRLVSTSTTAAMVGAFCSASDPATTRVLGRLYRPHANGGSGWADFGDEFGILDSAADAFRDVSLSVSPSGNFLTSFWAATNATAQSLVFGPASTWTYGLSSFMTGAAAVSQAIDPFNDSSNGFGKEMAWDSYGNAYLAYKNAAGAHLLRYTGFSSWDTGQGTLLSTSIKQVQLVNDGFGVTAVWLDDAVAGSEAIKASWSLDSFATTSTLTSPVTATPAYIPDPQAFSVAADENGTVVVVFIQQMPNVTGTCDAGATFCKYRVFASVRNASGVWAGPMPIDGDLTTLSTSYYHDNATQGGMTFATPQVTYLGSGKFLAVFAGTDFTDEDEPKSLIYSRTYTAGSGWDSGITTVDSVALEEDGGGDFDQYRIALDLQLSSDKSGNGVLMANYVLPTAVSSAPAGRGTRAGRNIGYYVRPFSSSSGWGTASVIGETPYASVKPCPMTRSDGSTLTSCNYVKPQASIFTGGEMVIVFPAPMDAETDPPKLYLYTMEYEP